ncbi:hypothetical protein QP175_10390 [Sphingomonas aerolata]|uniref:hypothetical protein n=1 Tax=Sphingomonas aerolata TaxID=185951 RepID=UPI002FE3E0F3
MIGARVVILASCQPFASLKRITAIWSVKTRPKPGSIRRCARSFAATGSPHGSNENVMLASGDDEACDNGGCIEFSLFPRLAVD